MPASYGPSNPPVHWPENVVVTPESDALTITWDAPPRGLPPDRYTVRVRHGDNVVDYEGDPSGSFTHTQTGLNSATQYNVTVFAHKTGYCLAASYIVTGTPLSGTGQPVPAVPVGLQVTPGVESLQASWTASVGATSYEIRLGTGTPVVVTATTHTFTGLTPGQSYAVSVRALNSLDQPSAYSAPVNGIPAPPAPGVPANLAVTPGVQKLSTSWNSSAFATSYDVRLDGGLAYNVTGTSREFTGLNPGQSYEVTVRANNVTGSSAYSTGVSGVPTAPLPARPAAPQVTPGIQSLSVSWSAIPYATSYEVRLDSGTPVTVTEATHLFTDLTPGQTYAVTVRAVNDVGASTYSIAANGIPLPPAPSVPANVLITPGVQELTASWTPGSYIIKYEISLDGAAPVSTSNANYKFTGLNAGQTYAIRVRAVNASGTSAYSGPDNGIPLAPAPAVPAGLAVTPGVEKLSASWNTVSFATSYEVSLDGAAPVGTTNTNYEFTGLTPGQNYTIRVRAINATGTSNYSTGVTKAPSPPAPAVPENLAVTPDIQRLTASWDAVTYAASYQVSLDGANPISTTSTSRAFTGLTPGQSYTITVRAVNATGSSDYTTGAAGIPLPPAPTAPSGLTVTPDVEKLGTSWTAVPYAVSYEVRLGTGVPVSVTDPNYEFTGLTPLQSYTVSVRTINATGTSSYSSGVSGTPKAPIPEVPEGLAVTAGEQKLTASWDAVTWAASYGVSLDGGAPVSVTDTDHEFTGLTPLQSYTITVRATNATGSSAYSGGVAGIPLVPTPAVPSNFKVEAGDLALSATWDAVTWATSYELTLDGVLPEDPPLITAATGFEITGLNAGQSYAVRVRAINSSGMSNFAGPANGVPTSPGAAAPENLVVEAAPLSLIATWDAVPNALSYEAQLDNNAPVSVPTGLTHTFTGLIEGFTYSVRVRAILAGGPSDYTVYVEGIPEAVDAPLGESWSRKGLSQTYQSRWPMAYGNGTYLAMTPYAIERSTNEGSSWTRHEAPADLSASITPRHLAFGGGRFIVMSNLLSPATNYYPYYSDDNGVTWTKGVSINDGIEVFKLKYVNDRFIILKCQASPPRYSTNGGTTWPTFATSTFWTDIAFGNGVYVMIGGAPGGAGSPYSSATGATFTLRTVANAIWQNVAFGAGIFVATSGNVNENRTLTSTDGTNWTLNSNLPNSREWGPLEFGNGRFVLTAKDAAVVAVSTDGLSWTEYPIPATQEWLNIVNGAGTTTLVGWNNQMMFSSNGQNWSERSFSTPPVTEYNYRAIFYNSVDNNHVLLAGKSDIALTSSDMNTTFKSRTLPAVVDWSGVAYGNGVYVAVSGSGAAQSDKAATSSDGINWTLRTMPSVKVWSSVAFGNGLFVATSANAVANSVATSPDGITWTPRAVTGASYNVIFENNLFVVPISGANAVYTSPDGLTWTSRSIGTSSSWRGIAWSGSRFLLAADSANATAESVDGITWTYGTNVGSVTFSSLALAYGNGIFVAVTDNGPIWTNTIGRTWVSRGSPAGVVAWGAIIFRNGEFVAVGENGIYITSTDGITWSAPKIASGGKVGGKWIAAVHDGSKYVALASVGSPNSTTGATTTYVTSSDGLNWTERYLPSNAVWSSIAYGGGKYVAISYATPQSTATSNKALVSNDGINWTPVKMPSALAWQSVVYGLGKFVAIAGIGLTGVSSSAYATSSDGITWTQGSSASAYNWQDMAFGNNVFVAVSASGTYTKRSIDGTTWTNITGATGNWRAVTYGAGLFVAVGMNTRNVQTSVDGSTWIARTNALPVLATWRDITYANGMFVAVACDSNIAATSTDGIVWSPVRTLPVTASWNTIVGGPNQFIALGHGSSNYAISQ